MNQANELESLASSIQGITSPFRSYLSDIHEKFQPVEEGKITNYPPELIPIESDSFGINAITMQGEEFEVGDTNQFFTLQNLVNLLVYGVALEDYGREYVTKRVSVEPSHKNLYQLELTTDTRLPKNPLSPAGAITVVDLIKGDSLPERLQRVLDKLSRYTGRSLEVDTSVLQAQKAAGNYERGLGFWLRQCGVLSDQLQDTLKLYFDLQAVLVSSNDVAMIAATLANGGINPITEQAAIEKAYVQDLLSLMLNCGLGNDSQQWFYQVGIPTQSSIGGGTFLVIPNQLGVGIFSPLISEAGYSVRGLKVAQQLSQEFGLHIFNAGDSGSKLQSLIENHSSDEDW
ncbi:L-glutaminase [Halothece sp. PCC 7418]|uniref:glutaminase n=1 Tax=Halothece sp. (strain PCC 7418) TaxID=65093 RepID=UPI0002A0706B|nr:glutaminase [Halothece sp. PCC 7418]AFZ45502.1 L-glutaminase [Halothece sp. PCC 7418]